MCVNYVFWPKNKRPKTGRLSAKAQNRLIIPSFTQNRKELHSFPLVRAATSSHLVPVFKPRWKKEAILLLKGAKKFLHYKRDLLAQDRIDEIHSRRADLKAAIKSKDLDAVKEASKQYRSHHQKR